MNKAFLIFDHQDGQLRFQIKRAVYCMTADGAFSCSVECASNEEHDFMSEPSFCFMRCPVSASGLAVGTILRIPHRQGDRDSFDQPSTHLYAGTHFDPWDAQLQIIAIEPGRLEVLISFLTDDPNYYFEEARDTRGHCQVWLSEVPLDEVRDLM